jgi:hypothetical protein
MDEDESALQEDGWTDHATTESRAEDRRNILKFS